MKMIIKPLETFLFRNAKPFDFGDTLAESIFPPNPSTVYGAIRTAVISQKSDIVSFKEGIDEKLKKEIGTINSFGEFKIKNLFLYKFDDVIGHYYFSVPRDLVKKKKDYKNKYGEYYLYPLIKVSIENYKVQNICKELELFETEDKDMEYPADSWLKDLEKYLKNDLEGLTCISGKDIYEIEEKIGITIDYKKGTAKDKNLFTQRRIRLKEGFSFLVNIENLSLIEKNGILTLGQDRRIFSYTLEEDTFKISDETIEKIKNEVKTTGRFKILFLTPVMFKKGWLSKDVDENYIWRFNGSDKLKFKIKSVFNGNPYLIGGWDIQRHRPKPLEKFLPAGTVFYCELIAGDVEELFKNLFDKNICDDNKLNQQGFGYTLIGINK